MNINDTIFKIGTDIEHYVKIKEEAYIEQPLKHETEYELRGVITTTEKLTSNKKGQILTYEAQFTGNIELVEVGTVQIIKGKGKNSYSQRLFNRICGYAKDVLGVGDIRAHYEQNMRKLIAYWDEIYEYLSTKS